MKILDCEKIFSDRSRLVTVETQLKSLECFVYKIIAEQRLGFLHVDDNEIIEVKTWLYLSILENAEWTSHVDKDGCPHKISKCRGQGFKTLHGEAVKFLSKWKQHPKNADKLTDVLIDEGEPTIVHLPQGQRWVKINTVQSRIREASRMRNCLAKADYDADLRLGRSHLYSLRTDNDKPILNVFFDKDGNPEFFKKANGEVTVRDFADLLPLFKATGREACWWFTYAQKYKQERVLFMENLIARDPSISIQYAAAFLKRHWLKAEPFIMSSPSDAVDYAERILKRRWPEAEETILTDPMSAARYAHLILHDRWPEAEPVILTSGKAASYYAGHVIKDVWPDAESVIRTYSSCAYFYAKESVKGRWVAGEQVILQDPWCGYWYCRNILKIGNSEYERETLKALHSDDEEQKLYAGTWAGLYARKVTGKRFEDAEPLIRLRENFWDSYRTKFHIRKEKVLEPVQVAPPVEAYHTQDHLRDMTDVEDFFASRGLDERGYFEEDDTYFNDLDDIFDDENFINPETEDQI